MVHSSGVKSASEHLISVDMIELWNQVSSHAVSSTNIAHFSSHPTKGMRVFLEV